MERNKILVEEQNGFRAFRSCLDHVFSLCTIIKNRLTLNLDTYICFIDFKKAFDFVNRDLLLLKLISMGINGKMCNAIKESLIQTSSCIKINNFYTEYFNVDNGVRQGDPISTTLFSVFINDVVEELNKLNVGINIDGYMLRCLLYADDLVLIAETPNDIQLLIDILNTWANKWRLTINIKKSEIMHFRKKCKRLTEINFKMGDAILEKTSKYKYLGVMLDEFLKFDCASDEFATSAQRALGAIISKYKLFKDMGFNTYTKLFNTGVIPILDYCAPVWSHIQFPKIEQIQHRALRVYMGVNRFAPLHGIYEND